MKQSILYSMFGNGIEHLTWTMESNVEAVQRIAALYRLERGIVRRVQREDGAVCFYLLVEWEANA